MSAARHIRVTAARRRPRRGRHLSGRGPVILVDPSFSLDEASGRVEGAGPHVVPELTQLGQALGAGTVQPAGAVPTLGQEARVFQDREVLAHGRAGDVEGGCDLAGGKLLVGDELQDGPPSRLSQGPERIVGGVVHICGTPPRRSPARGRHAQRPTGLPSGSAKMAIRP